MLYHHRRTLNRLQRYMLLGESVRSRRETASSCFQRRERGRARVIVATAGQRRLG